MQYECNERFQVRYLGKWQLLAQVGINYYILKRVEYINVQSLASNNSEIDHIKVKYFNILSVY